MAKESVGEIFRRGDYYLTKRIREIVGAQRSKNTKPPGGSYGVQLYDASESKIILYAADEDGLYNAIMAATDDDVIMVPPGSFTDGLLLADNGNYPGASVCGISRINTKILTSAQSDINTDSSVENLTFIRTHSSTAHLSGMAHWQGGTASIINAVITMDQNGTGDCEAVYCDNSSGTSILNIWNSVITGDAASGSGYALWCDAATINCYNCHLRATHADINATSSGGTINLYGCRLEEI